VIPAILRTLTSAQKVVIFSGAGLSADSGIPTFRDGATGLWANVNPLDVASIDGFRLNPEKVWAWHEEMYRLFNQVVSNPGHEAIACFEILLQPRQVSVITQNIDGLHQEAGTAHVIDEGRHP
jgi:NAD-dependent deacetylase